MSAREKLLDAVDKSKLTPGEFLDGAVEYIAEYSLLHMDKLDEDGIFWDLKSLEEDIRITITRIKNVPR